MKNNDSTSTPYLAITNSKVGTSTKYSAASGLPITTTINVTSAEIPNESSRSMQDLYTFLIVLSIVLILVIVLTGIFFLRKHKDKISIKDVKYPTEHWQDQEDINNIVPMSYCPNPTATNTVYTLENASNITQRYKKKENTVNKPSRYSDTSKQINCVNCPDKTNRNERAISRKRSNSSSSSRNTTDITRKEKYDYADKFVTTAVGSNFYSYNLTVEQTTSIEDAIDDCIVEINSQKVDMDVNAGVCKSKPPKKATRAHKVKESKERKRDRWNESFEDDENMNVHNFREQLKRSVEDWSAEESDA